jgi:hypothetical protein
VEPVDGQEPRSDEPILLDEYRRRRLLERPVEIVEFERATDPYANMLPGISNIRAAQTVGRGVEVGRRGNRVIMAVSVLMLLALLLPLVLAVITQLGSH